MSAVLYERRGPATWITINRPKYRNAIDREAAGMLFRFFQQAIDDDQCMAIVLTGSGDEAFCAGGDLRVDAEGSPVRVDIARPLHPIVDLFKLIETCTKPVVARINGHAMGAGFGLVCAADIAICADHVKLGAPETKRGFAPMIIMPHMLRIVPRRRLLEMCITGEPWSAAEAMEIGIVNYIAPSAELDDKLAWMLGRIVDKSPTGIRLGKFAFHGMADMPLKESLDFALAMMPRMLHSEDAREGLRAFFEKRKPEWTGN